MTEANERLGYTSTYFGEAGGEKVLEYEVGPHVDSEIFSIYGNQDAAVLALTNGDIDYLFNPLGLEKGFQDRIRSADDLQIVSNAHNGVFYLGFNVRKAPMSIKEFRQVVATLIDKEFVAQAILQDAAIPMYAMVPEGNAAWHNSEVTKFGQGMTRGERIKQAVVLLKSAGFTYEQEPEVGKDGSFVAKPGKGLKLPDGTDVPAIELLAPSAGYDPLRATFAIWVERLLANTCELCGSTVKVQMHHVRALKDLRKKGRAQTDRLDGGHGSTASQDARGLCVMPRGHPCRTPAEAERTGSLSANVAKVGSVTTRRQRP